MTTSARTEHVQLTVATLINSRNYDTYFVDCTASHPNALLFLATAAKLSNINVWCSWYFYKFGWNAHNGGSAHTNEQFVSGP